MWRKHYLYDTGNSDYISLNSSSLKNSFFTGQFIVPTLFHSPMVDIKTYGKEYFFVYVAHFFDYIFSQTPIYFLFTGCNYSGPDFCPHPQAEHFVYQLHFTRWQWSAFIPSTNYAFCESFLCSWILLKMFYRSTFVINYWNVSI